MLNQTPCYFRIEFAHFLCFNHFLLSLSQVVSKVLYQHDTKLSIADTVIIFRDMV